jgi:HEAT repeat protein
MKARRYNTNGRKSMTPETVADDLLSDDVQRRTQAAERLARLGPEARPAAVALCRASDDREEPVRDWATAALEELGPPRSEDAEPLARLVTHQGVNSTYWAATLLGRLGPRASAAVATLADALAQHPVMAVRQRAAWALGEIGPQASSALGELKEAASSSDARLARLARRAVEQITGHPE